MIITPLEKLKSPKVGCECYEIDLKANGLPTEDRSEVEAILKIGMNIEINDKPYTLVGVHYFAVNFLPYGKVGILATPK